MSEGQAPDALRLSTRSRFPCSDGAVEVAASTNGQLTPPVMGAAAFLIAEFTGISYLELITHAVLPAIVSYIGLMYIVHLEALKLGLQGSERSSRALPLAQKLGGLIAGFLGFGFLGFLVHLLFGWTQYVLPEATIPTAVVIFLSCFRQLVVPCCFSGLGEAIDFLRQFGEKI